MADTLTLLTDQQVQEFLVSGYAIVEADYPAEFHADIRQKIETVFDRDGNPGNNILPLVPDIRHVFEHPNVAGALTSLLGPDYILNPHRHCHLNPPGRQGQKWHKDCYVYDNNIRHPRFDWILAFYYPQDTTHDMGPSGILPGRQYLREVSSDVAAETTEESLSAVGRAGTVTLIHFDAWHRATENISEKNRYMLKFQFARTREPEKPAWNHTNRRWAPVGRDLTPNASRSVWHWLLGDAETDEPRPTDPLDTLIERLNARDEAERLAAAYQLAAFGEDGIAALTGAMRAESIASIEETTSTPADNLHGTNPTAGCAAQGLVSAGAISVPSLLSLLTDEHWWVRATAANAIGRMGPTAAEGLEGLVGAAADSHWWVRRNAIEAIARIQKARRDVVDAVTHALSDEDYRVRRNAALAVIKFGAECADAVEALVPLFEDENRYNRFYAAEALRRVDTARARDILIDRLFTARWCPLTSKDSTF